MTYWLPLAALVGQGVDLMPDLQYNGPYFGSFKKGPYLRSDRPVDEIWNVVSRHGVTTYLQRNTSGTVPWEQWGPYAVARLRQAIEFRAAARQGSVLTRLLPLYYYSTFEQLPLHA